MRTRVLAALAAVLVAAAFATSGCTSDDSADSGEDSGAVEVDVSIADGKVTPLGEKVDVQVDQTVRLSIDSDVADELHVHSDPDHSFEIEPGDDQTFTFSVDTPGQVAVELHELGDTVVQLVVRP